MSVPADDGPSRYSADSPESTARASWHLPEQVGSAERVRVQLRPQVREDGPLHDVVVHQDEGELGLQACPAVVPERAHEVVHEGREQRGDVALIDVHREHALDEVQHDLRPFPP